MVWVANANLRIMTACLRRWRFKLISKSFNEFADRNFKIHTPLAQEGRDRKTSWPTATERKSIEADCDYRLFDFLSTCAWCCHQQRQTASRIIMHFIQKCWLSPTSQLLYTTLNFKKALLIPLALKLLLLFLSSVVLAKVYVTGSNISFKFYLEIIRK